jgi:hypothetical protein
MNTKKFLVYLLLILLTSGILFFNFSCKNTLIDEIEQTVEIVVTPPEVLAIYPAVASENIPITLSTVTATFS